MIYRHAFDLLCYILPMVPGILPSQLGSLSEGRTCIETGWRSLLCWHQAWLVILPGFTQIPELRAGGLSCETSSGHCPKIVRGTSKARSQEHRKAYGANCISDHRPQDLNFSQVAGESSVLAIPRSKGYAALQKARRIRMCLWTQRMRMNGNLFTNTQGVESGL